MDSFLDLRVWLLVVAASRLGTAVTLTYYMLGSKGTEAVLLRFPQIGPERWERTKALHERHGSALLFFSFIPVLGMLLATAAGAVGIGMLTYVVWVFLGRMTRNWLLVLLGQALCLFWR